MKSTRIIGSWRISDQEDKRHREFAIMADAGGKGGDGGKVASVYAGFGHHFEWEDAEAHAYLIAAAPDLLIIAQAHEAKDELSHDDFVKRFGFSQEHLADKTREVIAKATPTAS